MPADLIFVNGQVVTVDDRFSVYEALATSGNSILAVGNVDEVSEHRGPNTQVLDLKGRALLPGLIDAHCHLASHGSDLVGIRVRYPEVQSIAGVQAKVREAVSKAKTGDWISGTGWDQRRLAEQRMPNRADLDAVAPDNPVVLVRACGHISSVNSRALELARLHEEVADPPGGRYGRDANGRLNGVLFETAQAPVQAITQPNEEDLRAAIIEGAKHYLSYGITSIHDAGGYSGDQFRMLNSLQETEVKLRVYNFAIDTVDPEGYLDNCLAAGMSTGLGTPWVKVGACKFVTDGSTSGPTCATRKPYDSDPHDTGIIYYDQEQMDSLYDKAHKGGFQLTAHAVGDRAIDMVVTAMERAFAERPTRDPRPRIEHCALLDLELIERIRRLGLCPAAQPVFFNEFGDGYLRDYGERTRYMFPSRTLLEHGIPVAASSDSPVTTNDPYMGMYEAMTRATSGGQTVYSEETVTIEQAIRMYTRNGAHAAFEESIKGTLEPGKLADLAILSGPILGLEADKVRQLGADMTVVGGEIVHDRGNISA